MSERVREVSPEIDAAVKSVIERLECAAEEICLLKCNGNESRSSANMGDRGGSHFNMCEKNRFILKAYREATRDESPEKLK